MEKERLVFSGGLDSTTCLLWAWGEYQEIKTGTFLCGENYIMEAELPRVRAV